MFRKSKTHRVVRLLLIFVAIVSAAGCANVVAPQGGPRDEDPPEVVRSEPPNYSTNYDGSNVRIFFNEFVRLENLRQKMLVSPPMKEMPEVRIRRRSIIMSINEELQENTTYNFFFGDAIKDITEGNSIPNFQFVVSTGDYVDSLSVRGEVKNAFDLNPEEGVYVMMYDEIYDSIPYKELPVYISRTDKEGRFEINNMRDGEYLMFALKDLNFNYIYDQPDEKIAFLDSLVVPEYVAEVEEPEDDEKKPDLDEEPEAEVEDVEPDLQEMVQPEEEIEDFEEDRLVSDENDTLDAFKKPDVNFYTLYLFKEKDTVQRISSVNFTPPGKLSVAFRIPFDSVYVEEYREPFERNWKFSEFSKNKDSLFIWLDNVERDSLYLKVWDGEHLIDTIKRSVKLREERRERPEERTLSLIPNHRTGRSFPYFEKLLLTAGNPIKKVEEERIEVLKNDSLPVEKSWEIFGRTGRRLMFDKEFEQDVKYGFVIPDSTVTDIFGLTNADTIRVSFTTSTIESYGMIMLNLTLPEEDNYYILQLMDGQDKVLKEKFINNSGEYFFHHLSPGDYRFKVIEDKRNSGEWDPGNYLRGMQPDPVYIMGEKIVVRQNWEHEVVWGVE